MKSVTGFAIRLGLSIASMACAALAQTAPRTPEGHWEGTIQGTVRVIVHVERSGSGLKGTLDSPDQGAMGHEADPGRDLFRGGLSAEEVDRQVDLSFEAPRGRPGEALPRLHVPAG